MLVLARRAPNTAMHPLVGVADVAVLVLIESVVPETYGAVRFTALFVLAVHAHLQGAGIGVAIGTVAIIGLVPSTALTNAGDEIATNVLAVYEAVFAATALATCALVGSFRTAESAGRIRARHLTRRTIRAESEIRRRVADALHEGPIQELIAVDMVLSAAHQAAERGEDGRTRELIGDAREATHKTVVALRDEIIDLGPYAFEELTYDVAVERCADLWRRRYGIEVALTIESLALESEIAGDLFRVTQEAVVNAGRHAGASTVAVSLRSIDGDLELRVSDDGHGFGEVDPLGPSEPGHLGLASMRERAELMGGKLEIQSMDRGTRVLLRAPLRRPRIRQR
jgi:two-component system NarL family sensor kinase